MAEVVTIGETMVAMTPKTNGYLHYIKDYEMKIAGAESNLAVGVCKLGHSAEWISSVGDDEFGIVVQNAIRAEGVCTERVRVSTEYRTGMMFKQMQSAETSVFYYRENSAASHMDVSWMTEEMLRGSRIFHFTGITPVLSSTCEEMIWKGIALAQKNHVQISFDPNIRRKLWKDRDYTEVLAKMAAESDILLLGKDEGEALFGACNTIEELLKRIFTNTKASYAAIKNGAKGAVVATKNKIAEIPPYPCRCIDPVGAGDAFNAGFLCGILEGQDVESCGKMGAIAGAMATENSGDIEGYPTRKQLDCRMNEKEEIYR